jgi:hypothetical protein
VFYPEVIAPASLADRPLSNYRAIVLSGASDVDGATIERLDEYVRGGGGLWLALGENVQPETFTRDWYADGGGLSPLPVDTLEVIESGEDVAATIHPPTREHVATLQLANTTQLDIDEVRVKQRWQFGARPESSGPVSTLLESGNGKPLVIENYVGQGRVIVQAMPLGLESGWSDLPQFKSYVVMVQDWLAYLTAPTTSRHNVSPGASIVAAPPTESPEASAKLITSRGREVDIVATDGEAGRMFRYSQTAVPGAYTVRFQAGGRQVSEVPYYVTRDAAESRLVALDEAGKSVLAAAGVHVDGGAGSGGAGATKIAPRSEPVWGALLVALVALLAAELLLANRLARQRHGFAVTMSA